MTRELAFKVVNMSADFSALGSDGEYDVSFGHRHATNKGLQWEVGGISVPDYLAPVSSRPGLSFS